MNRVAIVICLSCFSSLLASAQAPSSAANFYSREKESALGAQLAAQFRSESTIIENAPVNDYVVRVGNRLLSALPTGGMKYTFAVVDRDLGGSTHEPLALPGGYIFVPVSLLLSCRSEDEFAGMLAHAMAHAEARHGTRQATVAEVDRLRGQGTNAPSSAVIFVTSPTVADSSSLPSGLLSLQQGFEKEADVMAVAIMSSAGYDAEALANYIGRLQYDPPLQQPSALPPRDERVAALRAAIQHRPQN